MSSSVLPFVRGVDFSGNDLKVNGVSLDCLPPF